jgi:DNA-binding transcriptional ArsR family regulator
MSGDSMLGKLSFRKDNRQFICDAEVLESVEKVKPLFNKKCWEIFKELTVRESYPAELAKKLNMEQQEVYYYINKLRNANLVELTKREEKRGGLAKYYKARKKCFAFMPALTADSVTHIEGIEKTLPKAMEEFFYPFIKERELDAKIVIGAPDSHGEFKARARDAHIAAELACFLGSLCSSLRYPFVFLDTMLKHISQENSNLIIVGGPITNKTSKEVNKYLSAHFEQKNAHWVIRSENSGKEYTEDSIGIVEKIQHPFFEDKAILYLAGKRNAGTKAAVLALIQNTADIIRPNRLNDKSYAHVVEGLDLDSDGLIDHVEILE